MAHELLDILAIVDGWLRAVRCRPRHLTTTLLLMALAGLGAGWVDAVVGGGGLIQLPALLLGLPGRGAGAAPRHQQARLDLRHTTSSVTYYRRVRPDLRTAAADGRWSPSSGRSAAPWSASHIPKAAFNPIILVVLVVVGAYTAAQARSWASRPRCGSTGTGTRVGAMVAGFVIGVYDGALGPGTGSFLVFALVGLMGYAFLEASAKAKIANFATNLAALTVFVPGAR